MMFRSASLVLQSGFTGRENPSCSLPGFSRYDMTSAEWLARQRLGWCRQNAWITESACDGRREAQSMRHDGPRDVDGGILLGCERCPGLDYERERDISLEPLPHRVEPLPKPVAAKRKAKPAKVKIIKKSHRLCVVDGCNKFRQYGCEKMCKAHFVAKQENKGVSN